MKKIFVAIVACMICNVGWGVIFCEPVGTDTGFVCAPGSFPDSSGKCYVCPVNTYQEDCLYSVEECTPCPAGTGTIGDTAADHDSSDDCIPMEIEEISCNPGYYLPADSTSCTQCPKNSYCPGGTFNPTNTDSGITQCPDNTTSLPGSDSADDCAPIISCNPGYYLPANSQQCTQCPRNFYCSGGQYTESSTDSGITQCPDNMYSPLGSDSADDCGRILHIGEYVLYLRTAKLTSPALHVKIGDVIYYGDMFPA